MGMLCALKIDTQGTDWNHQVETLLQRASRLWVKGSELKVHLRGRLRQERWV